MLLLDEMCGSHVKEFFEDPSQAARETQMANKANMKPAVDKDLVNLRRENELLERQLGEVSAEADRLQV